MANPNGYTVQAILMTARDWPDASVNEIAEAISHGLDEGAIEPDEIAGFADNWLNGDAPDSPHTGGESL